MSTNINLLIKTDEESLKRKKQIKILNFIAVGSLLGVGLLSLGILIMIKATNLTSIEKEQGEILAKMSQFGDRQGNLFIANDRIKNISEILKVRKDFAKTLGSLVSKIPDNLSVDVFEIDEHSVAISGQSKSLSVIGEFINNLTDMVRNKEIIKSLTLNSLTLDTGLNTYRIQVKSEL